MTTKISRICTCAAMVAAGLSAPAHAGLPLVIDPAANFYTTYGDANVYSLAVMATFANVVQGAANPTNEANPYFVKSDPGYLQNNNLIVLGTGTNNPGVVQNVPLVNDAYTTPEASNNPNIPPTPYFSTSSYTNNQTTPGGTNPTGQNNATWNASVAALQTFLNGSDLFFFFNNNQENSGTKDPISGQSSSQSVAAWGSVWITAPDGTTIVNNAQYYLTNRSHVPPSDTPGTYRPDDQNGGVDFGDPTAYTGGIGDKPVVGTNDATDYVQAGGKNCLDANFLTVLDCGDPSVVYNIDNNLGANQAAYAVFFPELQALLESLYGLPDLDKYTLHVEVRLGCEKRATNPDGSQNTTGPGLDVAAESPFTDPDTDYCVRRSLNNGYEQIFIGPGTAPTLVPEPSTLLLLGIALGGLGLMRRRTALMV